MLPMWLLAEDRAFVEVSVAAHAARLRREEAARERERCLREEAERAREHQELFLLVAPLTRRTPPASNAIATFM